MAKGFKTVLIVICICLTLSACGSPSTSFFDGFFMDDRDYSEAVIRGITGALESGDKEKLKSMFSVNALAEAEEFDKNLDELFEYYDGSMELYNNGAGPTVSEEMDGGNYQRIFDMSYDVYTDICDYRLFVQYYSDDDTTPENVGIWCLYIIKSEEDEFVEYGYVGDGEYNPGLHVGIQNSAPAFVY